MKHSSIAVVCIALLSCAASLPHSARAQVHPVALENPGFEAAVSLGGWTVEKAPAGESGSVGSSSFQPHSGANCVAARHVRSSVTRITSAPVRLKVGRIYRLRGWIRTEDAVPDPLQRYPTALPAALSMASFPFTNTSMPVGGTRGWTKSEVVFVATQSTDRVVLQFGVNGTAAGAAWFDDCELEEVDDVTEYIPMETVRWHGPAFRYTDRGWTFVHVEGEPYARGYQYGILLAKEIAGFCEKLAILANTDNPRLGWDGMRTMADALMLRRYDEEYLVEMRGIAEGAAQGGASIQGRTPDLLDIVTLNSAVDLGQLGEALQNTANPLSGRSFRKDEEEANALERLHKCSSFLANGPASKDGRIVFAQLFMWGGYTGVHWNVICDVVPAKGHRLVYETFPGGIHSGADFYINDAGIMIGETTVMQTPFAPTGEPQSSRIRKAAQYSSSIDDVVRILTTNNNGLYTNDWLIGDAKSDETAILLLGTEKWKLWRSGKKDFPGGTAGFYWSVNNAKDPAVRTEYVPDPANAPFDVVFGAVNRDIAFVDFYGREKGKIDAISAVNLIATSPINRPHACDGKVTTSEMAERLVFMAHFGKVTQREKFPERGSRRMPDHPNAIPHLTLGYAVFSPVVIAEGLKARRPVPESAPVKLTEVPGSIRPIATFDKKLLWRNTVYPATDGDNWLVSGSAAYWQMLNALPGDAVPAFGAMRDQLGELNIKLQYIMNREGPLAPAKAARRYDGYKHYIIPRARGTYALHQLRLKVGNEQFGRIMGEVHDRYRQKPLATSEFLSRAAVIGGEDVKEFLLQWIEREGMPDPAVVATSKKEGEGWRVDLEITQRGEPYQFFAAVTIETAKEARTELVQVTGSPQRVSLTAQERPNRVIFNAGNDIPVRRSDPFTGASLFDDFKHAIIVYGTSGQTEANRTLALRYQGVIADQFTEDLLPVRQENGLAERDLGSSDLVLLGSAADNALLGQIAPKAGLTVGRNFFIWKGIRYGQPEDGIFLAATNPYNAERFVYLFVANSALQLWQMTRRYQPLPVWALFKGEQVVSRGVLPAAQSVVDLKEK